MKTNDQILERYNSEEAVDFFNIQRNVLLCLLPYKMAKPHLDEDYVMGHDNDTIPEDERWMDNVDIRQQMMDFMPKLHGFVYKGDTANISQGFLALRVWLWALEEEIYDLVEDQLMFTVNDSPEDLFQLISKSIGYKPAIEDISFIELPND